MKASELKLNMRSYIGENASLCSRSSASGRRFNHARLPHTENAAPQVVSLPSYFNCICCLNPPCDKLASTLFLNIPLRSPQGQSALQNMITLCDSNPQVVYCSSLQPESGHCTASWCAWKMNEFVYLFSLIFSITWLCELANCTPFNIYSIDVANRWEHVYCCHKTDLESKYDFAELCFQCNKWIIIEVRWFEHCQCHLNNFEMPSVQCNSLVFHWTLTTAGQCLFCLFNLNLSLSKQFHQFLIKQSWEKHLQEHFWQLEKKYNQFLKLSENKTVSCPDLWCAL